MHDTTFSTIADTTAGTTPADARPFSRPARTSSRRGLAAVLAICVLVLLAGAAWLGWQTGWLHAPSGAGHTTAAGEPDAATPITAAGATTAAIVAQGNLIATNAALADATARLTGLQQRLTELDQQAVAASGQATRAEALLVSFAARRAIERGQPLGYLETALRVRFGENQPTAVDQVVAAAHKPVTIGGLNEEFATIEPRLTKGPANEQTWGWLVRQVGGLFVIRHGDMPSPAPESRIARARIALAGQNVDLAIAEIDRLPGRDAAADWIAHARDYVATQRALDQLESAALSIPTVAATPVSAGSVSGAPDLKPATAPAAPRSSPALHP